MARNGRCLLILLAFRLAYLASTRGPGQGHHIVDAVETAMVDTMLSTVSDQGSQPLAIPSDLVSGAGLALTRAVQKDGTGSND